MVCSRFDLYFQIYGVSTEYFKFEQDRDLREISVGASHCHVENQVEPLIKWCVQSPSLTPWVVQSTIVDNVGSKFAPVPHVSLAVGKFEEENLLVKNTKVRSRRSIIICRVYPTRSLELM